MWNVNILYLSVIYRNIRYVENLFITHVTAKDIDFYKKSLPYKK